MKQTSNQSFSAMPNDLEVHILNYAFGNAIFSFHPGIGKISKSVILSATISNVVPTKLIFKCSMIKFT